MKQFIVKQNEAGQRLDKLLIKMLNKAPKSFIYKMLRKKNITLNGKKAEGSEILSENDEIKLFLSDETIENFREQTDTFDVSYNLTVVYEDKHILIINKPLGILSQKANKEDISIVEYMISYLIHSNQLNKEQLISFRPGVCNRLDRNTSGLLIAGKSLIGLQTMSALIKDRSLDKYYLCIVNGIMNEASRIEGYLYKDEARNIVKILKKPIEGADYICTEYEPLKLSKDKNYTLLKVKLITGRSHQIRAHLASIGHSIIGDYKYGDRRVNIRMSNNYGLSHQLLHSYKMIFPVIAGELSYLSGKEVIADIPDLFADIMKDLFGPVIFN